MNPMAIEAIGAIIRAALMVLAGYLVKAGIWDTTAAQTYVGAASIGLIGLGWSLFQKYKSRIKLLSALSTTSPTTEAALESRMKAGVLDPVSVTTPKTVLPGQRQIDLEG